jgi:hypothetical protein
VYQLANLLESSATTTWWHVELRLSTSKERLKTIACQDIYIVVIIVSSLEMLALIIKWCRLGIEKMAIHVVIMDGSWPRPSKLSVPKLGTLHTTAIRSKGP